MHCTPDFVSPCVFDAYLCIYYVTHDIIVQRRLKLLTKEDLYTPDFVLPCVFDAYLATKERMWLQAAIDCATQSVISNDSY